MNRAFQLIDAERLRIAVFLLCAMASVSLAAEEVQVIDLQANTSSGKLQSWSDEQLTVATPEVKPFVATGIRSMSFGRPIAKLSGGSPLIRLSNGDRIAARTTKIVDDAITVSWPLLSAAKLPTIPLEKTAALIFELPATAETRCQLLTDLDTLPSGNDLVMLLNGDRTAGEFQKVEADFVELKSGTNPLKIDRTKVRSIRLNPELTTTTRPPVRRVLLKLADGSLLTATDVRLIDGILGFKSTVLGAVSIPLTAVSSCEFFSDTVVPLADRESSQYEFTPFLSGNWDSVRNSNVLHGPLMLRGTEYATGIGVHSRSVISYALRGNERSFQAVVGIDDLAKGAGSAQFSVELDGRNAWTSSEVTGKSAPVAVPEIDLRGAKQLTLIVDFGQFADVADYADWCDAVLICDPVKK